MKIIGNQFAFNPFTQNINRASEKGLSAFWHNEKVASKQNMFGLDINQDNDIKAQGDGSIASLIQKKLQDDLITDKIAKKVARGQPLTEKEKETIREIDPEKLRKAEMANKEREELCKRLKSSKSKKEAKYIIMEAKMRAKQFIDSKDPKYGELLMEAVNKVEYDYNQGKIMKKNMLPEDEFSDKKKKGQILDATS